MRRPSNAPPDEIRPAMGGRLLTSASEDAIGIANYVTKREWRREREREVRCEGHDDFAPDPANPFLPDTGGLPIRLVTECLRPNGQRSFLCGTAATIWRYSGLDPAYVQPGYVDTAYLKLMGTWTVVGTGYSPNGRRWETENINGTLILNNAADPLLKYRVEEDVVTPVYELREQQIASVGTISQHDAILQAHDLKQINDDRFKRITWPIPIATPSPVSQPGIQRVPGTLAKINNGTDGQPGTTLTLSGPNPGTLVEGTTIVMANGAKHKILLPFPGDPTATVMQLDGIADLAEPFQPIYIEGPDDFKVPLPFVDVLVSCQTAEFLRASRDVQEAQATKDSAQQEYDDALKLYNDAKAALAQSSFLAGQLSDAITKAESALEITPNDPTLLSAIAFAESALQTAQDAAGLQSAIDVQKAALDQASANLQEASNALQQAQFTLSVTQSTSVQDGLELFTYFSGHTSRAIGLYLYWDSGDVRQIVGTYNGGFIVNSNQPIPPGPLSLSNPLQYAAFTDPTDIVRIQNRVTWSLPEQPDRWASTIPCKVDPQSNVVTMRYPAASITSGKKIFIIGAGTDGGNLSADALLVNGPFVFVANSEITSANGSVSSELTTARAALTSAQSNYANAVNKTAAARTSQQEAQTNLTNSVSDYSTLNAAVITDQAALDALNSLTDTLQTNLINAETTLQTAQDQLAFDQSHGASQTVLLTDQIAVNAAQQAVNSAQFAIQNNALSIQSAQADLTNAKAAIPNFAVLSSALDAANLSYNASVTELSAALTAMDTASAAFTQAQAKSLPQETDLQLFDAVGSIAGQFDDIGASGAAIIKALTLRTELIIYLEDNIFISRYTGDVLAPFIFEQAPDPQGRILRHRDTLVAVGGAGHWEQGYTLGGAAHIFAGDRTFWRFDGVNKVPMEIEVLRDASEAFFKSADPSSSFAARNYLTQEIFFCCPNAESQDQSLRYDYHYNTASTGSLAITAAQTVVRPGSDTSDIWFVMGTADGGLFRYGLTTKPVALSGQVTAFKVNGDSHVTASQPFFDPTMVGRSIRFGYPTRHSSDVWLAIYKFISPTQVLVVGDGDVHESRPFAIEPAIYHRSFNPYDSVLASGVDSYGLDSSEKLVNSYTPMVSSETPRSSLILTLRAGLTPGSVNDAAIGAVIADPVNSPNVPCLVNGVYIGDRISAVGINNPVGLSGRIFDYKFVHTHGFGRSAAQGSPDLLIFFNLLGKRMRTDGTRYWMLNETDSLWHEVRLSGTPAGLDINWTGEPVSDPVAPPMNYFTFFKQQVRTDGHRYWMLDTSGDNLWHEFKLKGSPTGFDLNVSGVP